MNDLQLHKLKKATDIASHMVRSATTLVHLMLLVPGPAKSMRICQAHRRRRAIAKMRVHLHVITSAAQYNMIASTTMPGYPLGGLAFIKETGPEVIEGRNFDTLYRYE